MANPRFAWGIDIGNRALKAIKLIRDGESLRIDDIDVIEHEQVLSNSGDNRDSLIQTALANFAQRHVTKGGVVSVGVSGQSSFARFIKLPPVEEKKIPEIVRFEAIQQIPFPLDSVEWSYQLFRDENSPDVEVGIFAMRKELVNQQLKFFHDLEMKVGAVQMNPLAVYNAMYYDGRLADGTTMILDLGAENADLIIAEGESVWLRSIPIGGNNFTEALTKAFKLNFNKAEELKRNAQTSKYARQIFQAMRPVFADLVAEIQRSIGFYSSVHRDSKIKKIIALGNTFRLPTLQKYLHQNLQIEVERLDGFNAGAPDDGRLAATLNDNIASMGSAYGLALQAMGQGKIKSSLLPHEIQKAEAWQEKAKWFAAAAAIFVLAAGVKYGVYYYHNAQFEAQAAVDARNNVETVLKEAENLDRGWGQLENAGADDKRRITNVMSMQRYRDVWSDLWTDIVGVLPPDNARPAADLAKIPRDQRKQIFVESLSSSYVADLGPILKLGPEQFAKYAALGAPNIPVGAAAVGGGDSRGTGGRTSDRANGDTGRGGTATNSDNPDAAPVVPQRGYLVTLQLSSPTANAPTFVDATVVKGLMEKVTADKSFAEKKPYYIPRAMLVSAPQLGKDEARRASIKQEYDRKQQEIQRGNTDGGNRNTGGTRGPTGGGRGDSAPVRTPPTGGRGAPPTIIRPGGTQSGTEVDAEKLKAEQAAFEDPNYPGETRLNDYFLTVLVAVVLDPPPPAPADPDAETQQAANDARHSPRDADRPRPLGAIDPR